MAGSGRLAVPLLPSFSVSVRSHAELNHQVALLAVGDCSYEPLAGIALTMKLVECASTIIEQLEHEFLKNCLKSATST